MSATRRRQRAALSELTPGQHLRAEIERLGLDQVAVRKATGVSRQTINNIVNDRQPISRAMAGKLGRLTGHRSDYWLRASFSSTPRAERLAKRSSSVRPAGGVLVNYQITHAVKNGIIGMDPFDEANVQAASVDLTLGDFLTTTDGKKINIGGGQRFTLQRNCTVHVSTKECIELPQDYVGRVGAIACLAENGIFTSAAFQIAPGFSGHLQFCIFNSGGENLELRGGMPIVSIEVVSLGDMPIMSGDDVKQARQRRRRQ
jgi:deoxycytidine triphosphate deaminase/addiction module HigA family antidote